MLLQVWLSSIFGLESVMHEWPQCWLRVGMGESIFLRRWGRKEVKGMLSFYVWGLKSPWDLFLSAFLHVFCTGPQMAGSYKRARPCLGLEVWCEWPSFSAHFMPHLCHFVVRQFEKGDRLCCGLDSGRLLTVISRFGPFVPLMCFLWDLIFAIF